MQPTNCLTLSFELSSCCSTDSFRSGVGAVLLDSPKLSTFNNLVLASSHSSVGAFRCDFTTALFLCSYNVSFRMFGMILLFSWLFWCMFSLRFLMMNHHTVLMATVSLTPLLSWLKDALPGTYPSSYSRSHAPSPSPQFRETHPS